MPGLKRPGSWTLSHIGATALEFYHEVVRSCRPLGGGFHRQWHPYAGACSCKLTQISSPFVSKTETDIRQQPGIPTKATAQTQLGQLTVKSYVDPGGYSRDLFPHWNTYSGACNTREYVLQRDGTNVVTNSACAATSGSWYSPFDGATWTAASDVDIDHMVPLKNAWVVSLSPSSPIPSIIKSSPTD